MGYCLCRGSHIILASWADGADGGLMDAATLCRLCPGTDAAECALFAIPDAEGDVGGELLPGSRDNSLHVDGHPSSDSALGVFGQKTAATEDRGEVCRGSRLCDAHIGAKGIWFRRKKKYELIEYDYLVRIGDWNAIIAKAEKQMPDLPMSVSATNLALGMTNQLGERAFEFYQRGTVGLLPKSERNFATMQLTGEIYFNLGLVNTAQRFAFEAMEAIPNYNKSARVMKRLAETNLINGQYQVAEKYLRLLEKTVFYRLWAQRMIQMLGDEKAINEHPLYGTLRQYRLKEDLLFSDRELDKICGQLFMHNQQNQMAAQYLLMIPLLDRDIPRFMQYVQAVQNRIQYNPRHCQEAIAFAFMQQNQQPPQGVVNQLILQQMNDFARVYSQDKNSPELAKFRNTVWYYLTVGQ